METPAAAPRPAPAPRSVVACALFFLSGAVGLLYEVLWSRQFAHHLGGSYPAVVAVVTAFLAGLAAGAALGGRWAPRLARPLRAYGWLELGIGLYGLLFPLLLAAAHPLLGWLYRTLGDAPVLHTTARFLVAGALLLPPTVAMGATLPVLVRHVTRAGGGILGGTGLLYGLNTVGAAAGALWTGFVLLPSFGLQGTLFVGVAVNVAIAIAAWIADRGPAAGGAPTEETRSPEAPLAPFARRALLLLAGGSGAAAMIDQLAWTKAMILAFGSSVHAFTLVLASFILGLGLGGLCAPLVRARGTRLLLVLAGIEAAVGVTAWIALHRVAALPLAVILDTQALHGDYDALLRWQFGQALLVVLLPTAGMGAAFPLLVAALSAEGRDAARRVGQVYGWNTAGTILGSLGGGMLLIPALGIRDSLLVATVLNLALAAVLAASALPRVRGAGAAAAALLLSAGLVLGAPAIPPELLGCGPYLYGPDYLSLAATERRDLSRVLRDLQWDMPFFREGRTATVGVVRRPEGATFLRINGKTDAGTGDLSTQVLLGQLPALARPGAKSGLVIGLATGLSAAAVASHGIERLDVVDICPEVVEASRLFADLNGHLLDRPGVRVIVEDGRTHVEHARTTYDIIVTEPTNPWIAGVSNLFTVEYFRACRERLATDGVLCVWLQAYGMSGEDFRMVVRTVRSVFPGVTVWEANPYLDFVLLAPKDGSVDLVQRIASREFPTGDAAANLALGEITSREALLATLALDGKAAAAFAGEGPLHTDDRLQLEFRAPRGAFADADYRTLTRADMDAFEDPRPVLAFAGADPAPLRAALAARFISREGENTFRRTADADARARFRKDLAENPGRIPALAKLVPVRMEVRILEAAAVPGGKGIGEDLLTQLMWAHAVDLFESAINLCPGNRLPLHGLAERIVARGRDSLRAKDFAGAERDFLRALGLEPANATIPLWIAKVHNAAAGGDPASPHLQAALLYVDEALRLNPRYEAALVEKGATLAVLQRDDDAEAVFRAALAMRPDSLATMNYWGQLLLYKGRDAEARALVERGLAFEPGYRDLLKLRERIDAKAGGGK